MVHRNGSLILIGAALVVLVVGFTCVPAADADVIAQWRFEPDNPATPENEFLADSSGNGNVLANFGVVSQNDPMAGFASRNSAAFDGSSAYFQTASPLDLSPYSHIRISWWQKVADATSGIVWEHSPTFIQTPGSIIADVNDGENAGLSKAGLWGANPAMSAANFNLDQYENAYDNTWEHVAVELNLNAAGAVDIVRPFSNGNPTGIPTTAQTANPTSFLNDTFYIGARGGSSVFFNGNIDELTIETVPEMEAIPPNIPPIANQSVKLYVLAGQSNMVGQYAPSSELPVELQGEQADVVVFSQGQWTTLHPGINTATPNDFGPEITFGRTMADSLSGESVVLVKYAVGATTLADNWNSTTPGPLYTGMVTAVAEAVAALSVDHDVEIAGLLWMQGESDALNSAKAAAYETNFQDFVDNIRTDLAAPDMPIAVGQIADDSVWVYRDDVRQAVTDVAALDVNTIEFSTDALPTYSHHYNAQGQQQLGELFAAALGASPAVTAIPEPGCVALLLTAALFALFLRGHGCRFLLICCVVLSPAMLSGFASTAAADVVAQWRFEPDDTETTENEFLLDSSGNGNTLANFGAFSQSDPNAGFAGIGGAAFDGVSHLQTAATLDLSPYRQLLITWWQKVNSTTGGIVWEHSDTFISKPGAIVSDINDGGNLGLGKVGMWGANPALSADNFNLDSYTNSYDNTWEHVAVEINLDAEDGADVVWVFRNGNLTGIPTTAQTTDTTSFLDDIFYIGARGGSSVYFQGMIDELTIQGFPDVAARIPGDANEDGIVNAADAAALAANWLLSGGATWDQGDFNEDGSVNDIDATIMAANWQTSSTAAVPEPASVAMFLAAMISIAIMRRRTFQH